MSNEPIKMNRLLQMIRLCCQGTGGKTIHGMVGIFRNTKQATMITDCSLYK